MVEPNHGSAMSNSDQIFHDLDDPVEYVDEYKPGGYHPLRLGECLRGGRYLVLRKLGYGSYSTVWLARDQVYVFNTHYIAWLTPVYEVLQNMLL